MVNRRYTNLSSADRTVRHSWAQDAATRGPTADAKNATYHVSVSESSYSRLTEHHFSTLNFAHNIGFSNRFINISLTGEMTGKKLCVYGFCSRKKPHTNAITGFGDFTKGRLISVPEPCSEVPAKASPQ